jgi:ribosomal protein L21
MFAVIKTGGKQYKVSAGDVLKIEKLDLEAGQNVDFTDVFMMGDKVGAPAIDKAMVKATVLEQMRDRKVLVYKKKRRQGYDRLNGHRQHLTVVHIDELIDGGKTVAKAEPRKPAPAAVEATPVAEKKPAAKQETVAKAEKKTAAPKQAAAAEKKPAAKKPAAKKTSAKED